VTRPKLRLIQGGRGRPPLTISGKALLEDIRHLSHDEAAEFVIGEINAYIHERGAYRVGRLYRPGVVEVGVSRNRGAPRGTRTPYTVTVIANGNVHLFEIAPTVTIAAFRLLELWEEEEDER